MVSEKKEASFRDTKWKSTCITLAPKSDKDSRKRRKLQANLGYKYKHKNPLKNCKLNPTIHKI